MENCPLEILEDILFRLPFAAAVQAAKVCKTWKTLVTVRTKMCNEVGFLISYYCYGNKDVKLYFGEPYDHIHGDVDHSTKMMNYYYGKLNIWKTGRDDVVVGSCNGLVCLRKRDDVCSEIKYLICNPLTREYVFVPQIDYNSLKDRNGRFVRRVDISGVASDGFGYCQSTNEYKVVRVHEGNILVYTIGSHQWRNLGMMQQDLCYSLCYSRGVFANGLLHWFDRWSSKILGFDLNDEKFRLLPMPCDPHSRFDNKHLKLLGGNLCLVKISDYRYPRFEIWAYKKEHHLFLRKFFFFLRKKEHDQKQDYNDDNKSLWNWVKEFSIESAIIDSDFEPFAVTRSNQVLLWNRRYILYSYDPKTSTSKELWDVDIMEDGMRPARIECVPHTNSFVSLKDLGESGATIWNSRTK